MTGGSGMKVRGQGWGRPLSSCASVSPYVESHIGESHPNSLFLISEPEHSDRYSSMQRGRDDVTYYSTTITYRSSAGKMEPLHCSLVGLGLPSHTLNPPASDIKAVVPHGGVTAACPPRFAPPLGLLLSHQKSDAHELPFCGVVAGPLGDCG